jgi:hypothetical protein
LLSEKIARLLELCLGFRPAGNELSCRIEAAATLNVTLILKVLQPARNIVTPDSKNVPQITRFLVDCGE